MTIKVSSVWLAGIGIISLLIGIILLTRSLIPEELESFNRAEDARLRNDILYEEIRRLKLVQVRDKLRSEFTFRPIMDDSIMLGVTITSLEDTVRVVATYRYFTEPWLVPCR